MGIFEAIRSARAKTRAEIKAAEAKVKVEAANKAKLDLKREKLLIRQEKNLLKAEQKGLKSRNRHERKLARTMLEQQRAGSFNKDTVKRWTGAARLLTPLLIPVLYRLSTETRDQLVNTRARRAGVSAAQLSQYTGHGATLRARIEGVRRTALGSGLPRGFVQDVEERLDELDAAVANSEYMAVKQRNRAHQTIDRDLNQVSDQIQDRLLDH